MRETEADPSGKATYVRNTQFYQSLSPIQSLLTRIATFSTSSRTQSSSDLSSFHSLFQIAISGRRGRVAAEETPGSVEGSVLRSGSRSRRGGARQGSVAPRPWEGSREGAGGREAGKGRPSTAHRQGRSLEIEGVEIEGHAGRDRREFTVQSSRSQLRSNNRFLHRPFHDQHHDHHHLLHHHNHHLLARATTAS